LRAEALSGVCAEDRRHRRWPSRNLVGSTYVTIAAIMDPVRVWRERRRVRRQLSVMSVRELSDIGLCRGEITHEIGKPFWRK